MSAKGWAMLVVPVLIAALCAVFCGLGYLLTAAIGLPTRLGLPWAARGAGAVVLLSGMALMAWIWTYRPPGEVLLSTFETIRKAVRRAPLEQPAERTEPLVLVGPQRWVRNPMYLAVVVLWLGWWLVLDYTLLMPLPAFFLLWFNLVVIPMEERELLALYGHQYSDYIRAVPRFFPTRLPP